MYKIYLTKNNKKDTKTVKNTKKVNKKLRRK